MTGARIAECRQMLQQREAEQDNPAGQIRCRVSIATTDGTGIES